MYSSVPWSALVVLILSAVFAPAVHADAVTEGMLRATGPDGEDLGPCPLKHTDVDVRISGFVARVVVTQTFHNPYDYKIEGVYVFPLSQNAAVDDMTMVVGERVIRGMIKPREEARAIYEAAKAAGHVTSLLDQERPNIFTQSVANIEPGVEIEIQISYAETLDWEDGTYQFDFPMVVGPRYIPGGGTPPAPMMTGQPTAEVPDANRITPPVIPKGMRAGHDISLSVAVAAGFTLQELKSLQHEVDVTYTDGIQSQALVKLKNENTIPNKDFVLTYRTVTAEIGDTVLTHWDERGGFFTLILQPPEQVRPEWIVPKEMIFVIDKSGSMNGFPIDTAKATMKRCIENLNPDDTFNLMTFAGGVGFCFPNSVANNESNVSQALQYLGNLQGSGGTEMMKAIDACLGGVEDSDRIRVVCFMTDGYVGNDMAIIDAVQKHAGTTRVFSFGIGRSVNRFLLDGIARAGRGAVEYVLSPAECDAASDRFYDRVTTPVLTDINIDWGGLPVDALKPGLIPDLFSANPVVIKGRYSGSASGVIRLSGRRGNEHFERAIQVSLLDTPGEDEVVASLWARAEVADLMNRDLANIQRGVPTPDIKSAIVDLAMRFRLLTQFTSFVAVEEKTVTEGGESVKVLVPVEMPEGVSYEGVFGASVVDRCASLGAPQAMSKRAAGRSSFGRGVAANLPSLRESDARNWSEGESQEPPKKASPPVSPADARDRALTAKLAVELQGLAARVGDRKDYSDGYVEVKDGRITLNVYLVDSSDETMKKLAELGFTVLLEEKSIHLVIGSIDVVNLEALALLDEVRRVRVATKNSE